MIFGEHTVGWGDALTVGPGTPQSTSLMKIKGEAHHEAGLSMSILADFDRADVERLRDLCNEALS